MALMKCPECGHDMSTLADACPNCGYKLVQDRKVNIEEKEEKTNNNYYRNDYTGSILGGLVGYSILRSLFRPRPFFGPMGGFGPGPRGRGPRF